MTDNNFFLQVVSSEKWVDYVKEKIQMNQITHLNLSDFEFLDDIDALIKFSKIKGIISLTLPRFFKKSETYELKLNTLQILDISGNFYFITSDNDLSQELENIFQTNEPNEYLRQLNLSSIGHS
jgi:hypothetical protein